MIDTVMHAAMHDTVMHVTVTDTVMHVAMHEPVMCQHVTPPLVEVPGDQRRVACAGGWAPHIPCDRDATCGSRPTADCLRALLRNYADEPDWRRAYGGAYGSM